MKQFQAMQALFVMVFLTISGQVKAIYAEVPFEDLVHQAAYIVQAEVISKTHKKVQRAHQVYNGKNKKSELVTALRSVTAYELKVKSMLKGKIKDEVVTIESGNHCNPETGVCVSGSLDYWLEIGDKTLIFLNYHKEYDIYKSSGNGRTVYFYNDQGVVFHDPKELELTDTHPTKSFQGQTPFHIDQLKPVIEKVSKMHKVTH